MNRSHWSRELAFAMTLAGALLTGAAAHANLLTNGAFEDEFAGSSPGEDFCSTGSCTGGPINGWTTTANAYTSQQGGNKATVPAPNDMNAYIAEEVNVEGTPVAEGTLSQSVSVTNGAQYVVSFYVAVDSATYNGSFFDGLDDSLDVSLTDTNNDDVADYSMQDPTDPFTSALYTPGNYIGFSFDFTALSTSTTLTFSSDDTDGQWYVDDVSIDPVPAAVPEPNSLAILLAALFGFGAYTLVRRRNRMVG